MRELSVTERIVYSVPVIGWMLKDVIHGHKDNKWYFLAAVVSIWAMAILTFGYPAFFLPILAMVPVAFVALVLITRG